MIHNPGIIPFTPNLCNTMKAQTKKGHNVKAIGHLLNRKYLQDTEQNVCNH